jgi:thiamine biosynthesis lipoprotein
MNTLINIFIAGEDRNYSKQAAFEAFKEIDIMEERLSRFLPNSDISRINNLKAGEFSVVTEDTLNCLMRSIQLYDMTEGAFDISIGNSIEYYKEGYNKNIEDFSSHMQSLLIDPENFTVLVENKVNLDLGGIGKGYAAEQVHLLFEDWGIANSLLSFGYSTIKTQSSEKEKIFWPITITNPINGKILEEIGINDISVSSSGIAKGSHIIDPVNCKPVGKDRFGTWVFSKDAILTDALSTAFMIMDEKKISDICSRYDLYCILINDSEDLGSLGRYGSFAPYKNFSS